VALLDNLGRLGPGASVALLDNLGKGASGAAVQNVAARRRGAR
jgi:N-acetyl-gamma-glutamylphosphate reductase